MWRVAEDLWTDEKFLRQLLELAGDNQNLRRRDQKKHFQRETAVFHILGELLPSAASTTTAVW